MQTTSDLRPPKRARAKTKHDPAPPTVAVKKPRVRKASPAQPTPAPAAARINTTALDSEQLNGMIATAAYFLAQERGFAPGHELDDWLEAERRIKVLCFG